MTRFLLLLPFPFAASLALVQPAGAQGSGERINQVIIYGDDPCPQSTGDEITVCAVLPESERFRIPEILRESRSPENEAWANRAIAYRTVGRSGTLSCSPVGGGGWTGCVNQMIETARAERLSDPSLRFSQLIAEEREKRLATIDSEAAEQQARVEEEERKYFERQQQEKEAGGSQAESGDGETQRATDSQQ
ncbi:MAG: hypothetical protein N2423_00550 [Novosphingobium sp.]|nr:hypothetical protein [Novosphingobium sp.]